MEGIYLNKHKTIFKLIINGERLNKQIDIKIRNKSLQTLEDWQRESRVYSSTQKLHLSHGILRRFLTPHSLAQSTQSQDRIPITVQLVYKLTGCRNNKDAQMHSARLKPDIHTNKHYQWPNSRCLASIKAHMHVLTHTPWINKTKCLLQQLVPPL